MPGLYICDAAVDHSVSSSSSSSFDLRFQKCCENALQGALQLVSFCSGVKESFLENDYRAWCDGHAGFKAKMPEEEEDDDQCDELGEEGQLPASHKPMDCMDVLANLQGETTFMRKALDADEGQPSTEPSTEAKASEEVDSYLALLPDSDMLKHLMELASIAEPFATETFSSPSGNAKGKDRLPATLLEAFNLPGDRWNGLFRFAVKLRCTAGACDRMFIQNPMNSRKASRKLNWYQQCGSKLLNNMEHEWTHSFCNVFPRADSFSNLDFLANSRVLLTFQVQ